jgi:tripartite-type tricarboxylate transporter receptor subunit TctC
MRIRSNRPPATTTFRYALIAWAALGVGPSLAQDYPARPVRIVTSPAGGGNDLPSRLVARGISGPLGQQVIVDYRPAILAPEIVAKAAPDGYTVLVAGSTHWVGPLIEKVSYDPLKDFATVALIARAPVLLVVHPSMPINSVRQLVSLAKSRPGVMNSSVGAPGSSNYLGAVLFDYLAGVKITRIPYKGAAPAMTALMSGEVQVMFPRRAPQRPTCSRNACARWRWAVPSRLSSLRGSRRWRRRACPAITRIRYPPSSHRPVLRRRSSRA